MRLVGRATWKRRRELKKQHPPQFLKRRVKIMVAYKPKPHAELYGSGQWARISKAQLARQPLCEACGDAATEVDHIKQHKGDLTLFFATSNLQSLCGRCHIQKTKLERSLAYKYYDPAKPEPQIKSVKSQPRVK